MTAVSCNVVLLLKNGLVIQNGNAGYEEMVGLEFTSSICCVLLVLCII